MSKRFKSIEEVVRDWGQGYNTDDLEALFNSTEPNEPPDKKVVVWVPDGVEVRGLTVAEGTDGTRWGIVEEEEV